MEAGDEASRGDEGDTPSAETLGSEGGSPDEGGWLTGWLGRGWAAEEGRVWTGLGGWARN